MTVETRDRVYQAVRTAFLDLDRVEPIDEDDFSLEVFASEIPKLVDAVLAELAKDHVVIERERWERVRRVAKAARWLATTSEHFEKISWQFPELTEAALAMQHGDADEPVDSNT